MREARPWLSDDEPERHQHHRVNRGVDRELDHVQDVLLEELRVEKRQIGGHVEVAGRERDGAHRREGASALPSQL